MNIQYMFIIFNLKVFMAVFANVLFFELQKSGLLCVKAVDPPSRHPTYIKNICKSKFVKIAFFV